MGRPQSSCSLSYLLHNRSYNNHRATCLISEQIKRIEQYCNRAIFCCWRDLVLRDGWTIAVQCVHVNEKLLMINPMSLEETTTVGYTHIFREERSVVDLFAARFLCLFLLHFLNVHLRFGSGSGNRLRCRNRKPPTRPPACPPARPSVRPSIRPSIHPPTHPPTHPSIHPSTPAL